MKVPQSGLRVDDPSFPLLMGLISYWGVTTANGLAGGTTVVCDRLANEPSYDGLALKILTGPAAGQMRTIEVHAGNTLTVGVPFSNNPAGAVQQITAGTLFVILSILGGGGGPGPAPTEGLSYYGVVDAVPGANQFTIGGLAGLGAGKFVGVTNPYSAFVLRKGTGTGLAPQGEIQAITAYVTATGTFTTAAFGGGGVAIGDEILIVNPTLAKVIALVADPWAIALPGAYGVGTAGNILGTNLDALVSSRAPGATALSNVDWPAALATALSAYTAAKAAFIDVAISSRASAADWTNALATALGNYTAALATALGLDAAPTSVGKSQIKARTIDVQQAAATYDLFTGTTQDVVVEKLVIRFSGGAVGGTVTSISIQTDDATPQVIIPVTLVALLTNEAQLSWTGAILLDAGTNAKIRLTIDGGIAGAANLADVIAEYRAVVAGGTLA